VASIFLVTTNSTTLLNKITMGYSLTP